MITPQMVKDLRESTSCGMMDCKKALEEAGGDMEKAFELLREKGLAAAAKKSSRIAAEGLVEAITNADGTVGVCVEINSETDFVAKNDDFKKFVNEVAKTVLDTNPTDVEALLNTAYVGSSQTVADVLREKILTIGENMTVRRFARYVGSVATYVHGGGRIGVMVNFDTSADFAKTDAFKEMAKDVAMQIAAANPLYLNKDAVPADVLEKEKEILSVQARNEGKPENIIEKMVMGRISKYYAENCLVDQAFIKDPDISVTKFIDGVASANGTTVKVLSFVRFEKGEGLEKREDDFAAEVEKMAGK